jgi:protein ImuB
VLVSNPVESISHIPVHFLETDKKIITSLHQMGIHNVKDLLCLPEGGLIRRFGASFTDYLQRLTGSKPDPQEFVTPEPNFYHDITFLSDVSNLDSLAFPIKRLLGELSEFLTSRQLHVDHFTWHMSHRNHEDKSFSILLASPENNPEVFLTLTQLKLDQIRDVKEVDNIALAVRQFFPAKVVSGSLFQGSGFQDSLFKNTLLQGRGLHAGPNPASTVKENQLLNILQAKLGEGHCFGLSQSNDHRPEKAWKTVSALAGGTTNSTTRTPSPAERDRPLKQHEALPRPAFLLSTPKVLTTIDNLPCLGGKLELLKGPERIDYGWWDQPLDKPLARDYYIARQKNGSLYWVFQHIAVRRWYLHGIFS